MVAALRMTVTAPPVIYSTGALSPCATVESPGRRNGALGLNYFPLFPAENAQSVGGCGFPPIKKYRKKVKKDLTLSLSRP